MDARTFLRAVERASSEPRFGEVLRAALRTLHRRKVRSGREQVGDAEVRLVLALDELFAAKASRAAKEKADALCRRALVGW